MDGEGKRPTPRHRLSHDKEVRAGARQHSGSRERGEHGGARSHHPTAARGFIGRTRHPQTQPAHGQFLPPLQEHVAKTNASELTGLVTEGSYSQE